MYVFGEAAKVHLDCKKSATFPIACGRPVHIYQSISEWENNLESENLNRAAPSAISDKFFQILFKGQIFLYFVYISIANFKKISQNILSAMNPLYGHFLLVL